MKSKIERKKAGKTGSEMAGLAGGRGPHPETKVYVHKERGGLWPLLATPTLLPIYEDREEGRPFRKPCPPFSILRDLSYDGFQASRTRNRRLRTRRGSVVSAVAGPSPSAETALFFCFVCSPRREEAGITQLRREWRLVVELGPRKGSDSERSLNSRKDGSENIAIVTVSGLRETGLDME